MQTARTTYTMAARCLGLGRWTFKREENVEQKRANCIMWTLNAKRAIRYTFSLSKAILSTHHVHEKKNACFCVKFQHQKNLLYSRRILWYACHEMWQFFSSRYSKYYIFLICTAKVIQYKYFSLFIQFIFLFSVLFSSDRRKLNKIKNLYTKMKKFYSYHYQNSYEILYIYNSRYLKI